MALKLFLEGITCYTENISKSAQERFELIEEESIAFYGAFQTGHVFITNKTKPFSNGKQMMLLGVIGDMIFQIAPLQNEYVAVLGFNKKVILFTSYTENAKQIPLQGEWMKIYGQKNKLYLLSDENELHCIDLNTMHMRKICSLELFEDTTLIDIKKEHMVIANYMADSTTSLFFTLDLKNITSPDMFAFEGPILTQLQDDNEDYSESMENCAKINVHSLDDLNDENIIMRKKLKSLIQPHLYVDIHHDLTYLDILTIDENGEYVMSGGRDHKVYITEFSSHKIKCEIDCDSCPRCGKFGDFVYSLKLAYFTTDSGSIYCINLETMEWSCIAQIDSDIKDIEIALGGMYIFVYTEDNTIILLDKEGEIQSIDTIPFELFSIKSDMLPPALNIISNDCNLYRIEVE